MGAWKWASALGMGLGAVLLGAGLCGCSAAHRDGNGAGVRIAYFPNVTHAPALIGVANGAFAKALGSSKFEATVVNAGPQAMEALLANAIDMSYVGPSPALNTFIKAHDSLRIVSGVCSGGASLVAAEGSGITAIKDLADKKVAVPQLGGTQDVSLRRFMGTDGLAPIDKGGTVTVIPMANPDILTVFRRKQIDAAWVPEPWATRIVQETGARRVVDERTLWPDGIFTTTVIVARKDFLDRNPALVAAVVRANAETIGWMNAHPAEAKTAFNEQLKRANGKELPVKVLDESWGYVSFTSDPHEECFGAFLKAAKDCGYLKSAPENLEEIFDLRFLPRKSK